MGALGSRIVEIDIFDPNAWLQKINKKQTKYQTSIFLALIEHVLVITLTMLLFIVFGLYNIILGFVLVSFRTVEGLIQIYDEKNYWRLFNIARQHSDTSDAEKESLSDECRNILREIKTKYMVVGFVWGNGTLAFSILLVTYGVVPLIIGWLGIVASVAMSFSNGITLVKPNLKENLKVKIITAIGGLGAIIFEVILGVWLVFYSLIIS